MKIRAVAAAALAVALSAGLAGCNMISPQRTTMHYDASDGVSVELGDIALRNVLLITNGSGEEANLVFAAVNNTTSAAKVEAKIGTATSTTELTYAPNAELTKVGYGDSGENVLSGTFEPGSTVEVTFTSHYTDKDGAAQTSEQKVLIPVLGGENSNEVLQEYRTLEPKGKEESTAPSSEPEVTRIETPAEGTDTQPVE